MKDISLTNHPVVHDSSLGLREKEFASILWRHSAFGQMLGRRDIHRLTRVHPTLAGLAVSNLIQAGVVKEGPPLPTLERGRPQTSLEIDPDKKQLLGLSISPGEVRLASLNLIGKIRQQEVVRRGVKPAKLIQTAADLLRQYIDHSIYSIGITITGLIDAAGHALLFSSALPSAAPVSLEPLYAAAGRLPIILDNDMHALASRWLLTSNTGEGEVLLVGLDDGRLGASVLIDGKPQRGSVRAANELGHMRLPVKTQQCFCGQTGCLERIFSSNQLHREGAKTQRALDYVLADPRTDSEALEILMRHLAMGLANAVNFIRPSRLIIASPLVKHPALTEYLKRELPRLFLPGLRTCVRSSFWEQSCVQSAENAAWLVLADIFGQPILQFGTA